ncbi:hypothetical protein [Acidithiobacillus sp.]|uniref:hypothetical protein n=1 Tax=Acidithiobacillus sp. TaxID=1872118 RepID=UPI0023090038|nr:hypothetical protein [Acidithiobacillus sp.]MDA8247177.1 hypothetical protein [Acidithiobacillus sp.]
MLKIQAVIKNDAIEKTLQVGTNNIMILLAQAIFALPLAFMVMIGLVILTLPMVLHGAGQTLTYAQFAASFHHLSFGNAIYNVSIVIRAIFLFSWVIAWFARIIMAHGRWIKKSDTDTNPNMALRASGKSASVPSSTLQGSYHA